MKLLSFPKKTYFYSKFMGKMQLAHAQVVSFLGQNNERTQQKKKKKNISEMTVIKHLRENFSL